ncbi:MAG: MFS transporter, partial [Deltaproteobacteria bacterium]|nr:MFS transporter [Deltaproteobacteria bacterium]
MLMIPAKSRDGRKGTPLPQRIALAYAPNYTWAVAALIVAGVGGSFYHPAATAMVARLFPTNTGKALGLTGIGASVGFFAGPLFAGWRAASLEPSLGAEA